MCLCVGCRTPGGALGSLMVKPMRVVRCTARAPRSPQSGQDPPSQCLAHSPYTQLPPLRMGNKFSKKKAASEDGKEPPAIPAKGQPSVSVPTNASPTPDSTPSDSPGSDQASKVCKKKWDVGGLNMGSLDSHTWSIPFADSISSLCIRAIIHPRPHHDGLSNCDTAPKRLTLLFHE